MCKESLLSLFSNTIYFKTRPYLDMDLYCNVLSGVIPPDTDDRHWLELGGYTFESVFSILHHTWHYTGMDFANLTIPRQLLIIVEMNKTPCFVYFTVFKLVNKGNITLE